MRSRVVGAVLMGLASLATDAAAREPVTARSVVDWGSLRAIALESDDWGLAGFIPAAGAWDGLDRAALRPGNFPEPYWESTLENGDLVGRLAAILADHRGRDGLPAVLQPNYVMASLDWDAATGEWRRYELPSWPPAYARPGLWDAVEAARRRGVWEPELHAHLHYDPARRRTAGLEGEPARTATARGIMVFPGSEAARELDPGRDPAELARELDSSLAIFAGAFGRPPASIIAPDYHWFGAMEDLWESRGLTVIQAKREQRDPGLGYDPVGRIRKYAGRQWARLAHPGRTYLERNCRLEPVQAADPDAVVAACVAATEQAWRDGAPAIVETHRVNFVHTDPEVEERGLAALADYLERVTAKRPGPVFLTDGEIAQLARRGTSWRRVGDRVILRNGSRATRVVAVPEAGGDGVRFFRVPAGGTLRIPGPTTP